ncbi:hypothetical protein LR48_Vigan205s008700 [Vigna angularis]|uniref:Uncharacterized protein n=1 Tax=Phaseolus angularis TaxID=3914 RepID=A0A0L9T5T9_PHAAN|nr:hypothetical protein LR48_Vigan205s008700 [Vigna angularis]
MGTPQLSLHGGIPPAMAQECSNGMVVQDNQLWSPPPDNHPLLCIPLFKPLEHPLLLLFLTLLLPLLLRHHPYEPMTRRFNPLCNLVKLFIREMTKAPKAYSVMPRGRTERQSVKPKGRKGNFAPNDKGSLHMRGGRI